MRSDRNDGTRVFVPLSDIRETNTSPRGVGFPSSSLHRSIRGYGLAARRDEATSGTPSNLARGDFGRLVTDVLVVGFHQRVAPFKAPSHAWREKNELETIGTLSRQFSTVIRAIASRSGHSIGARGTRNCRGI